MDNSFWNVGEGYNTDLKKWQLLSKLHKLWCWWYRSYLWLPKFWHWRIYIHRSRSVFTIFWFLSSVWIMITRLILRPNDLQPEWSNFVRQLLSYQLEDSQAKLWHSPLPKLRTIAIFPSSSVYISPNHSPYHVCRDGDLWFFVLRAISSPVQITHSHHDIGPLFSSEPQPFRLCPWTTKYPDW